MRLFIISHTFVKLFDLWSGVERAGKAHPLRRAFCVFLFVFSHPSGLYLVPFWLWVLGAVLLLFPSGFFVCVSVCVFFSFRAFLGSFLALGAWRRAALFSVGPFVCVFVCVFSFSCFFGFLFLALGAGRRAALFSVGLFVCVFVCVFSSFSGLFC